MISYICLIILIIGFLVSFIKNGFDLFIICLVGFLVWYFFTPATHPIHLFILKALGYNTYGY